MMHKNKQSSFFPIGNHFDIVKMLYFKRVTIISNVNFKNAQTKFGKFLLNVTSPQYQMAYD